MDNFSAQKKKHAPKTNGNRSSSVFADLSPRAPSCWATSGYISTASWTSLGTRCTRGGPPSSSSTSATTGSIGRTTVRKGPYALLLTDVSLCRSSVTFFLTFFFVFLGVCSFICFFYFAKYGELAFCFALGVESGLRSCCTMGYGSTRTSTLRRKEQYLVEQTKARFYHECVSSFETQKN